MKESQHTEWKESWRDDYLRWICGFADAEGGVLVIGRNDKGRGIEKINHECREHGIDPPLYDSSMSGLMLTFSANPQHLIAALGEDGAKRLLGKKVGERVGEKVGKNAGRNLTRNQQQILELLRQYPHMAARELAQQVGISSRKIEQNIARLKELELLKRIGPARGGHWEVLQ
jgi:ATP-dependent DNA helicase RecG